MARHRRLPDVDEPDELADAEGPSSAGQTMQQQDPRRINEAAVGIRERLGRGPIEAWAEFRRKRVGPHQGRNRTARPQF